MIDFRCFIPFACVRLFTVYERDDGGGVALKLSIPDTIRPFLMKTDSKGVYAVKDWGAWLNRRFAKLGPLRVTVDGDKSKQYSARILGVISGKGDPRLIISSLVPEVEKEFFDKPHALTIRLIYVEWGFEVTSLFKAVSTRAVSVKGESALEVVQITDLRVSLGTHTLGLSIKTGVEMALFIRGTFTEVKPEKISLNKIWFSGSLPDDIGPEGVIVDKASLKLGESEPEMMLKLQALPERSGNYVGHLLEMNQISQLANYIERRWTNQASRIAAGQEKSDLLAAAPKKKQKRVIEEYLRPHLFLLGNDEEWVERLNKFGICVPVPEKESAAVVARLDEKRCDVIIGDADYWNTDALVVSQILRKHEKYSKVPLLWIAGPDNLFSEAGGQDLIDLGAYDYVDRHLPADELQERFQWASPKIIEMGDGPTLAVVSPSDRQQYRFGVALRRDDLRIVKVCAHESGIVSRLVEFDARWILIDSTEFGDKFDSVLRNCLAWATKGKDPRSVMLVEQGASEKEKQDWREKGVNTVIVYDPSLAGIVKVVHERIDSELAYSAAAGERADAEKPPQ